MDYGCRRVLELLGTRFPSRELELQYREFRASANFLRVDVPFTLVSIVMLSTLAAREVERNGMTTATFVSLLLVAFTAAQLFLVLLAGKDGSDSGLRLKFIRRRTLLVFLIRGVLFPFFTAVGISTGVSNRSTLQPFPSHFLMATGVVPLFLTSLAMPLLLEHHIAVQAGVALFMGSYVGPSFCRGAAGDAHAVNHILKYRTALGNGSSEIVNAMYGTDLLETSESEPLPACLHLMTFAYVSLGFVLPTYVLWLLEYSSRVSYLESKGALGNRHRSCWSPVGWVHVVYHAILLSAFFAVAWQALSDVFLGRGSRCGIGVSGGVKGRT